MAILELRRIRKDPAPATVKEHRVVSSVDDVNTMPVNQVRSQDVEELSREFGKNCKRCI